jgi:hypothetical protein
MSHRDTIVSTRLVTLHRYPQTVPVPILPMSDQACKELIRGIIKAVLEGSKQPRLPVLKQVAQVMAVGPTLGRPPGGNNVWQLGYCMGMGNPCGSWVWVSLGYGCGSDIWVPIPIPIPFMRVLI